MTEIRLRSHVGDDGILHLNIPSEFKEIDVDVTVTVEPSQADRARYNAWGKLVTRDSIENTIHEMENLRKEIAIESSLLQEMREEGRRF